MRTIANVGEIIEQLIGESEHHFKKGLGNEKICHCSIGELQYEVNNNQQGKKSYKTLKQCHNSFVCYFVATEKHKAIGSHLLEKRIEMKPILESNNSILF